MQILKNDIDKKFIYKNNIDKYLEIKEVQKKSDYKDEKLAELKSTLLESGLTFVKENWEYDENTKE